MSNTRFVSPDDFCVKIGRAVDNDIVVPADIVSGYHGVVFMKNGFVYYRDMSTNGTIVNNAMIHHDTVMIQPSDMILLSGRIPLEWQRIDQYLPKQEKDFPNSTRIAIPEQQANSIDADADKGKALRKSAVMLIGGGFLLIAVGLIATSMSDTHIYIGALALGGCYVLKGTYQMIKSFSVK